MNSKVINAIKEHGCDNVLFLGETDVAMTFPGMGISRQSQDCVPARMLFQVDPKTIHSPDENKIGLKPIYSHYAAIHTYRSDFDLLVQHGAFRLLTKPKSGMTPERIALLKDAPVYFMMSGHYPKKFLGFSYVPKGSTSVKSIFYIDKIAGRTVHLKSAMFGLATIKMSLEALSESIMSCRIDWFQECKIM
jgi:hypothetical protein